MCVLTSYNYLKEFFEVIYMADKKNNPIDTFTKVSSNESIFDPIKLSVPKKNPSANSADTKNKEK